LWFKGNYANLDDTGMVFTSPWERPGDVYQSEQSAQRWRSKAEKIIELYVDRTNGSTLEVRKSAVLFRYGKSDFEFGAMQAAELKEHLEEVFAVR
jgi:trehalose-6-phosphatase